MERVLSPVQPLVALSRWAGRSGIQGQRLGTTLPTPRFSEPASWFFPAVAMPLPQPRPSPSPQDGVHIQVYVHIHIQVYVHIHIHVHGHVHVHTRMFTRTQKMNCEIPSRKHLDLISNHDT